MYKKIPLFLTLNKVFVKTVMYQCNDDLLVKGYSIDELLPYG